LDVLFFSFLFCDSSWPSPCNDCINNWARAISRKFEDVSWTTAFA
jgi:hypothetical protein